MLIKGYLAALLSEVSDKVNDLENDMPLLSGVQGSVRKLVNAYTKPLSFKDGALMTLKDATPETQQNGSPVCFPCEQEPLLVLAGLKNSVPSETYDMLVSMVRKGSSKGGGFAGKCFHCGKPGHTKQNCAELDKNNGRAQG